MDDASRFDLFIVVLSLCLVVGWIWLCIFLIGQVLRSPGLSRLQKAAWAVLMVLVPVIGVLVYLIVRGSSALVDDEDG